METRRLSNNSRGFSLVEMLAVVAILVILLGISMVAAAGYRDLLKITELDNAAREIYMAAENRAVLLSGARRLSSQLGPEAPNTQFDYVSRASVSEELLPTGSIDPTLRDGDFYIVYDRKSGSVTDVFYAEDSLSGLVGNNFAAFYDTWAKSRSDRLAQKNVMLVGWYNGQAAQGEDVELDIPEEPTIKVMIENEEELTVTVEYTAPGPAALSVKLGSIDLTGSTYSARKRGESTQTGVNGTAYTCTWVLDSLTAGKFKELGTPGGNFTVTATIASPDSAFSPVSASDTNNSLFQEGSDSETAYIKNLRHLQNLDSAFSGVTGKTGAVQTADIRCKDSETYKGYDFTPIYNAALKSYNGRANKIWNLYVSGTKFTGNDAHAGLFSRTAGGTGTQAMAFQNIRMVNASVTAADGCYAGALVGAASDAAIQNCWVYWEPDGDVTDLKDVLGSDVGGEDHYQYQVNGDSAGGLVGYSKGNCTINGSLAATLVSGKSCAGGLIGQFDGGTATVKYSYADCYLTGIGISSKVAGLIGNLKAGKTAALTNCYAAGYIMDGSNAAGLCLGEGTTDATNAYTVVRRIGSGDFAPLTGHPETDTFKNTYFLEPKDWNDTAGSPQGTTKLTFSEMSDPSKKKMEAIAGDSGDRSFQWKTGADGQSHPYNLRTDQSIELTVYDYPGLKGLPHYGDWTSDFKGTSLVYYEEYKDGSLGVAGGNINTLKNDRTVVSDGYAVLCRAEDLPGQTEVFIEYTWSEDGKLEDKAGNKFTGKSTYHNGSLGFVDKKPDGTKPPDYIEWQNPDGENIHLYLFLEPEPELGDFHPDILSKSETGESSFYRYLNASVKAGSGTNAVEMSTRAFYNPHFAETVVPITANYGSITTDNVKGLADTLAKNLTEIKLRTPRHLYDLSRFKEYYNNARRDKFHQLLDLDYSAYTGYNNLVLATPGKPFAQQPIGRWGEAFAGTYDGDCRRIKNVVFKVDDLTGRRYAGLFGYSTGTLRNIVYEMDAEYQVTAYLGSTAENLYVGALVGGSAGTVYNCAVLGANLRAGASGVSLYVGGLAGQNQGIIRNCAAETARLSANCLNSAGVYIGGLVGENAASRSITASYAVGRIDIEADSNAKTAQICGFVGWNLGSISNSYAAVDLKSSGDKVEAYGFCGVKAGSQSGTAYLDRGNFSYRGSAYAANYSRTDDRAAPTRYMELAAKEKAANMGMGTVWTGDAPDPEKEFPYPAAVKDGEGKYVHYGQWPEPMPLGEMGVFYWEKLVDAESGGNPTYHMSALAVDPEKKTITKQSTLSEAHNDGRVVTDYGYGYYAKNDASVSLAPSRIAYIEYQIYNNRQTLLEPYHKDFSKYNNQSGKVDSWPQNKAANDALGILMEGYSFHCWDTYHEGPRASGDGSDTHRKDRQTPGLCLFKDKETDALDPNGGSFTLAQTSGLNSVKVDFCVNPQFADSMSVKSVVGFEAGGAFQAKPGTENNPYQIRCGAQLQDINWYDTAYTDVPIEYPRSNKDPYYAYRFPYLSGVGYNRRYYWKQTHDLDWTAEGNTYLDDGGKAQPGVFFTIAQGRGNEAALTGWFSGSYDGQNYTMKNFNIDINSNQYNTNCVGLFGAVQNAVLKNIVLYSETGNDTVTVRGRTDTTGNNAWYAGGVLAGVARSSTISNCAVAGYTIRDETTYARSVQDRKGSNRYYTMGGAIGGLVGMADKDLTGCTAAATIEIVCDHSKDGANAPIRVGGLVGTTTASVTNCYTGGEIVVTEKAGNAAIYAGRLIGGLGMGPFGDEGSGVSATVKNCYSYLTLPNKGEVVKEVYNIGGRGRADGSGTVTLGNNYYLSGTADNVNNERAVTYRQLADKEKIDGQSIYELLNAGQTPAPYSPVTSEVGGLAMAGRFSYAPKDRLELQGMDYPFPTVLTQTRVSDGMVFNVHYGAWELNGIMRPNGNRRIELDMFTERTYTETLTLSEDVTGDGTWGPSTETIFGDGVVKAQVVNGELTVTALKASDTPVTVTVTYGEHSLSITVYVTARVELRPNTVVIFPNDTVSVPLTAWGKEPGKQIFDVSLNGTLDLVKAEGVSAPVSAKIDGNGVKLVRTGEETEDTMQRAEVTYTYTQDGYAKENELHRMEVDLLDLPESGWDPDSGNWVIGFKEYRPESLEAAFAGDAPEGFAVRAENGAVILEKTGDGQVPPEGVKLKVTLTMEGLAHELLITVLPEPEAGTPEVQNAEPEGEAVILSQEGGTPLESAVEKMEEQPGGVDPDGAAVSAGLHDGGGIGADGGLLQRGQDQEQPGGAAEIPDPLLSPDPDL